MPKSKHTIVLEGKNASREEPFLTFTGTGVNVTVQNGVEATVVTKKGEYVLKKHPSLGIYQGELNGFKVHLTHKAWVGQIIYWA